MNIPFYSFEAMHKPLEKEFLQAFSDFIHSGWFVQGPVAEQFENEYALWNGTRHCRGVANGLEALILSLRALNIGAGDKVAVPSNTYVATWLAISEAGATIVPVEPDIDTYNMSPDRLEEILEDKDIQCVMPVHLYGQACEMDRIMTVCNDMGIIVVEDNAQAQGAMCSDLKTGSFGQANAVSFYPGKNLGALGEAGAVTTDLEDVAKSVGILRNYGSEKKYYNEVLGKNARIDELQSYLLRIKLKYIDEWNRQRTAIAAEYKNRLKDLELIKLPVVAQQVTSVWHQFEIGIDNRDDLLTHLKANGIECMIHYPVPPHLQVAYRHLEFGKGDFPIAEHLAQSLISLPIYPGLTIEQIDYVCDTISAFLR